MTNTRYDRIPVMTYLITTIIITMSLFFVDEAFYTFSWMNSMGNWIVFAIYGSTIFIGQLTVYFITVKLFKWRLNNAIIILIGASLAVLILATLVFG